MSKYVKTTHWTCGFLRTIRCQEGLTLPEVEEKSGGRWKASVVGAYERGYRRLTVQQADELLAFYGYRLSAHPIGTVPARYREVES